MATVTGPDGDSTVQVGSRLPDGDTVTHIDPYTVTLSSGGDEYTLKLTMPAAATDEHTALLPVDGESMHMAVQAAKSPAPDKALAQNMGALEAALKAAQDHRKSLEKNARMPAPPPSHR